MTACEPLVDDYYENDGTKALAPGRICWAPITYVERAYQVAEVAGTVPSDDSATTYRVIPYAKDHQPQPPVFGTKLRAGELMRVGRMKRRPAVVVSARASPWTDRDGPTRRHSEQARLLVPVYSVADHTLAWIDRVQRFEYNSHFFLLANTHPGGKPDREAFIRFEQAQSVHEDLIEPTKYRLCDEVVEYVQAWFSFFQTGRHNEVSTLLAQIYEAPVD